MKKIAAIIVLTLFILSACKPFGRTIEFPQQIDFEELPKTDSLMLSDIADATLEGAQDRGWAYVPDVYTTQKYESGAKKILAKMQSEVCKQYPNLRYENGVDYCTGQMTEEPDTTQRFYSGAQQDDLQQLQPSAASPDTLYAGQQETVQTEQPKLQAPIVKNPYQNSITGNIVGNLITGMQTAGTWGPYTRPDLDIAFYSLSTLTPHAGQPVTATVTAKNIGDYVATLAGYVEVNGRKAPITFPVIRLLQPNEETTGTATFIAPDQTGQYDVKLVVGLVHNIWHPTAAISIGGPGTGYQGGDGTWVPDRDLGNNEETVQIGVTNPPPPPTGPYSDLTVTNMNIQPTTLKAGTAMTIFADVQNDGTETCNQGTITTYLDGNQLNTYTMAGTGAFVTNLPSGQSFSFNEQAQVPNMGMHYFEIEATCTDPADGITYNDRIPYFFTVDSGTDIEALYLNTSKNWYYDNEQIPVSFEIKNNGLVAVQADFEIQSNSVAEIPGVATLAPNGIATNTYNLQPKAPGSYNIQLVVDPQGKIAEENITNNILGKAITVVTAKPDLTIERMTKTPSHAKDTDIIGATGYVKNIGMGDANGFTAEIYVDNNRIGGSTPLDLAQGEDQLLRWPNLGTLTNGLHTIKIIADPQDNIDETIETNNEQEITFLVGDGPDLEITRMEVLPAILNAGDSATLEMEVTNTGNVDITIQTGYTIEFSGGGMMSGPIPPLSANQTWTETINLGPQLVGTYNITMKVGHPNLIELDPHNNEETVMVNVGGALLPDMIPIAISPNPLYPGVGQPVTLALDVKNYGQGAAPNHLVRLTNNGQVEYEYNVSLQPGEEKIEVYTMPTTSAAGHILILTMDPNNDVPETNEQNNAVYRDLYVGMQPDIEPRISISPANPTVNDDITINMEFENIGPADMTSTAEYRVYTDGNLEDTGMISALSAGQSETDSLVIPPLPIGTHDVFVRADWNNKIIERNETNNEAIHPFSVTGPGGPGLPYLYLRGGTIINYPATPTGPMFVVGQFSDAAVQQYLGNVSAEPGDGLIRTFTNVPGIGWVIVIAGETPTDVNRAIDEFVNFPTLGPDEIYTYYKFRVPQKTLPLKLMSEYENAIGTTLSLLDYELHGERSDKLELIGFPFAVQGMTARDLIDPIATEVDAVYGWSPTKQIWTSWRLGHPSAWPEGYKYNGLFLVMKDTKLVPLKWYDLEPEPQPVNFEFGRALFSPPEYSDLTTYSSVFNLSRDVFCQEQTTGNAWEFDYVVTPGDVEVGQSCWLVSERGDLQ